MDDPDYYEIQESKCDFALLIQRFIQEGWQFVDINYGERKLQLNPELVAERNGERIQLSPDAIEDFLRRVL